MSRTTGDCPLGQVVDRRRQNVPAVQSALGGADARDTSFGGSPVGAGRVDAKGQLPSAIRVKATAFRPRGKLRALMVFYCQQARNDGTTTPVLVLTGPAGVGKTQLAAAWMRDRHGEGLEILVWVDASSAVRLMTAYAQEAARFGVVAATAAQGDGEAAAGAFVRWLAVTEQTWLVVLDNLLDPLPDPRWWPSSDTGSGEVLVTTRLRHADLAGADRRLIEVGGFDHVDAAEHLADLLSRYRRRELTDGAAALAKRLGGLPLALSHAAAYMHEESVTCRQYLDHLECPDAGRLDDVMRGNPDDPVRPIEGDRAISSTLLLSESALAHRDPTGAVRRALVLAATLDPQGHPGALWSTDAVRDYLGVRTLTGEVTAGQVPATSSAGEEAVLLLSRYRLLEVDLADTNAAATDPARFRVSMPWLTARAVRERAGARLVRQAAGAAAGALLELWPHGDRAEPATASLLRSNAEAVDNCAGDGLWHPRVGNPLRWRRGRSLLDAGAVSAAKSLWAAYLADAGRLFGDLDADDPKEVASWFRRAQAGLAAALARTRDGEDHVRALEIRERVADDLVVLTRADDPQLLTARVNLAATYTGCNRAVEAIPILESVVSVRDVGANHGAALDARSQLAVALKTAGRDAPAAALLEQNVTRREAISGRHHLDTVRDIANLASAYTALGRAHEALPLHREAIRVRCQVLGDRHRESLSARANYSVALYQTGRREEAIKELRGVVDSRSSTLGPDHVDTAVASQRLRDWTNATAARRSWWREWWWVVSGRGGAAAR